MMDINKKIKMLCYPLLLTGMYTGTVLAIPAFPGAEGAAAETVGGRGGRVIEVTNLNGSGPGSLREAVEASGPRTVVFKVSGIIDLAGQTISITNPYLTIAGQTAPAGGITIKGHELGIRTHDVVVRFIKIRTGTENNLADQVGDAIGMIGKGDLYNNIIDHTSLSWAHDENAQIWSWSTDTAPHNISYSWNIIAEGIDGHSTGFIAGSYDNTKDFKDVSLHKNLFANTSHRLPLIKIASAKMVNNLVYNWKHYATGIKGGAHMDIIANKYKPGPETTSSKNQEIIVENTGYGDPADPRSGAPGYASIYAKGNIGPHQSDVNGDNWGMAFHKNTDGSRPSLSRSQFERTTALPAYRYPITVDSIANTEIAVLQDAGASRRINEYGQWVANRGEVDSRIINDYKNGTGFIPASENEVGGYPVIPVVASYTDSDHDGMADAWEDMYGFDKHNSSDNKLDKDSDGYTNLEEFINGTNPNDNGTEPVQPPTTEPPTTETPVVTPPIVEPPSGDVIVTQSRVSASADDAEERTDGTVDIKSSDLELILDTQEQTTGIRFTNLSIPENAKITKAYIQFKVDETDYMPGTLLNIAAENTGNAPVFSTASKNISNRNKTNTSASWSPVAWNTVGAADKDQRTSDLSSVVQEVISETDWQNGNAMAFLFTGIGKHVAEAYDGDKAGAPLLYVEYTLSESVEDSTPPVITLIGDSTMILNEGDNFTDPGATALDNVDGDLTSSLHRESNVNASVSGTYAVTYTVADSSGNEAEIQRTVVVNSGSLQQHTIQSRVLESAGDVEEDANGKVYINSSDLELGIDINLQTIGLRFTNLNIPANALITKAYIQFKTDETDYMANTLFNIVGESIDDALKFNNNGYNVTERAKTEASATWAPAAWNSVGATGNDQRTSDLTAIVQEIVSDTGWDTGNAMVFMISGPGKRVAEAYDGDKAGAPLLYIEYSY